MKKWLITNEQPDPTSSLAPRYDLSNDTQKRSAFGLTDCKIVSSNTLRENYIWAINGPSKSNGRFPVFDWTQWANNSHLGMPDKFDFPWVKVTVHDKNEINSLQNEKMIETEI